MSTPGKMLCEAHCSRLKTYGDKVQAPLQAYVCSWFHESHEVGGGTCGRPLMGRRRLCLSVAGGSVSQVSGWENCGGAGPG